MADGPARSATVRPTIGELVARLVSDGQAFLRAEARLYRARAAQKAVPAGWAAGFIAGAIMFVQAAVVALLVGSIVALAPCLGAWGATGLVTLLALAIAALLVWLGVRQIARITAPAEKKP